jgi:uncharacterized caspase-like protein
VNTVTTPVRCANLLRRSLLQLGAAALLGGSTALRAQSVATPAVSAQGAAAQRRMALVIGNGAYRSSLLKNPVGDAQAVAASLKTLGYEVTLKQDMALFALIEALRDFSVRSTSGDVRLLFYAGHGMQVKGRNYLLPVDTEPQGEDEIAAKAADVGEFIDRLAANKQGLNIIVLDACRVNPFAGGVIVGPDGRRLKFRGLTPAGLARVEAPVGTLVAFSTAPNGVALDGSDGAHSIYAKHLLRNMQTPGLPIEQLFKRVRIGVAEETQRVQVPWESSSLTTDFCFRTGAEGHCG